MPRERTRYQTKAGRDRVQIKFSVDPDLAATFDSISARYQTQSDAETFRRLVVDEAARLSPAEGGFRLSAGLRVSDNELDTLERAVLNGHIPSPHDVLILIAALRAAEPRKEGDE